MEFLNLVAENLCSRFGSNLGRVALVFPNKRAGLFFNDILLSHVERSGFGKTVWAPAYMTISELFDKLSDRRPVQEMKAVCVLYQIYKSCMGSTVTDASGKTYEMTLDYFYGWGRQLLSDFSDMDCSLCDVFRLFDNVEAAKVLEELGDDQYQQLSPLIRLLKGSASDASRSLKDDFSKIWSNMYGIYQTFNERLDADGEAYEGARQRRVVEGLKAAALTLLEQYDVYAFVGFNLLLPTERELFSCLQKEGRAMFFWDYDEMYVGADAPMHFDGSMADNLKRFPNALENPSLFRNFKVHDTINYVASQSSHAGMRYAATWMRGLKQQGVREQDMAVVICDETMLEPVIHCIPDEIQCVNVTKGFPMTHTPVYGFILNAMKSWQPADEITVLLKHLMDDLHAEAARTSPTVSADNATTGVGWQDILKTESFFEAYTLVGRMAQLASDGLLCVSSCILSRLIIQVLRTVSIPFHGEPLGGVQVMGMLETRNLDFPHLLMLSVGEGIVPNRSSDRSFIPYDLRKYYGIMTGDERSRVYAYNFYRLLSRSHDVTLVYNASTDGEKSSGEMSRFMLQMLLVTDIPVRNFTLSEQIGTGSECNRMQPPAAGLEGNLLLSPSAIGEYAGCRMRYWFNHVARITQPDPVEDILPANSFGTVFHDAAEMILKPYVGQTITASVLENLSQNVVLIKQCVGEAMKRQIERENPGVTDLSHANRHLFEAGIIEGYIKRLLMTDAEVCRAHRLQYLATEIDGNIQLDAQTGLKGRIDRVDELDGSIRIVDYKTGHYDPAKVSAKSFEELFTSSRSSYVLQTLCYSLFYRKKTGKVPIPALYYVSKFGAKDWNPEVTFGDELSYDGDAGKRLDDFNAKLLEHISKTMRKGAFEKNVKNCSYCPYTMLCGVKAVNR